MLASRVVVLDFETTGLYCAVDRITEVAALRLERGRVSDRFVSLADAGRRIPADVVRLTGISNEMLKGAPEAREVVRNLADFIGSDVVVAHNASFDLGFLHAECSRIGVRRQFESLCTIRLARRIVPGLPSYALAAVASRLGLTFTGRAHRAEADALVTAELLVSMCDSIAKKHRVESVDPKLLKRITKWSIASAEGRLERLLARAADGGRLEQLKAVALRPTKSAGVVKNARSLRWRMYAAGNLRDLQTDSLYPRSAMEYRAGTDTVIVSTGDGHRVSIPVSEIACFRAEYLVAPKPRRVAKRSECVPTKVPKRWEPKAYDGRRWKFDARGVLHDKEYGFQYPRSAYVFETSRGFGVIVEQPGSGSRIIDARDIENIQFGLSRDCER